MRHTLSCATYTVLRDIHRPMRYTPSYAIYAVLPWKSPQRLYSQGLRTLFPIFRFRWRNNTLKLSQKRHIMMSFLLYFHHYSIFIHIIVATSLSPAGLHLTAKRRLSGKPVSPISCSLSFPDKPVKSGDAVSAPHKRKFCSCVKSHCPQIDTDWPKLKCQFQYARREMIL